MMEMTDKQWLALGSSLINGGALTPAEQAGFERAMRDRKVVGECTTGVRRETVHHRDPVLDNPKSD